MSERIESAWDKCKDWITDYDGMATEAYLPDIHISVLHQSLQTIADRAKKLEIWPMETEDSVTQKGNNLQRAVSLLEQGYAATLDFVYTIDLGDFDFDVHLMIDTSEKGMVDVEIIWWSDLAFPQGVDKKGRFASILRHFIYLQKSFGSKQLYVAPENTERPKENSRVWKEV